MNRFVPNSREAAAMAILVVLIVLVVGGLLFAKEMVDATKLELEASTTELEASRRRLQLPPPPASAVPTQNAFLVGANYSLAANALQNYIVENIESNGGKLVSVGVEQPQSGEAPGAARRVVVQTTSELEIDGLQSLLHTLETGRPLVLVDNLMVRRPTTRREGERDDKTAPRLTVELRVMGFFREGAK
jgi:general secretion pathway protein M